VTPLYWDDRAARPAWQQMAIDRTLADRAARDGTIVYRLYRWERSSVSFGANEAACRTWNRAAIDRAGVPCVRRPTGGRGVWHDRDDLTYAVTAPAAALGGLRLAYRAIHDQLARALGRLELDASVAESSGSRPTLRPGACFDLAVGGEVLVGGRKAIGSAQALFGPALLQHGAIARRDRQSCLARFRLDRSGDHEAEPVLEWPPVETVADAIVSEWRAAGIRPVPPELQVAAESDAGTWGAQFRDDRWTWRR